MAAVQKRKIRWVISLLLVMLYFSGLPAQAQYGGGTGEPNDPYQIATAEDLMLLGDSPDDYDKHFILTADINLYPNLPGRKVFNKAVIGPDWETPFTGVFEGNGHTISHLTIAGGSSRGYLVGLFGRLDSGATISNLGLEAVEVYATTGDNVRVGGLVGSNGGSITTSYSTGTVTGTVRNSSVGGLVGSNGGSITVSYSSSTVTGGGRFGGVGGLVGSGGTITNCYGTGSVTGDKNVGGLVGSGGNITTSYSTGTVSGDKYVGGLVGSGGQGVLHSVWDMETSGLTVSDGGVGLTTAEMMDPYMLGLNGFANDLNWILDAGRDYPRLAWVGTAGQIIPEPIIDWLDGQGTEEEPYHIDTADQLILLRRASGLWDKHFILGADINLDPNLQGRQVFSQAVIQVFSGVFDGNGHVISHLTIAGKSYLGLFGQLGSGATISNLVLEAADVTGTGAYVGGLVGINYGSITNSYSTGTVSGDRDVGGLVGSNRGNITTSYSIGTVSGYSVGGLVGSNRGSITMSYSIGTVSGDGDGSVGGLVGGNYSTITNCYSTGAVSGTGRSVSGLVGYNDGTISNCYATGSVSGNRLVGGLVGSNRGSITTSNSTGAVRGWRGWSVGGLVGYNYRGSITTSYSTGTVTGDDNVGGLVGKNEQYGSIATSYSTGTVSGNDNVGGLVGYNSSGTISNCYSTGSVTGTSGVGGLIGIKYKYGTPTVTDSFWDIQTSGQTTSDGGTGKTTAEMQTAGTFLQAGWDFMDETANGTDDIWWILEGQDYPRLWWQAAEQ